MQGHTFLPARAPSAKLTLSQRGIVPGLSRMGRCYDQDEAREHEAPTGTAQQEAGPE
jgi:hypothetical protein